MRVNGFLKIPCRESPSSEGPGECSPQKRPGPGWVSHVGGFVSGTLCDTSLSPGTELESPEDLLKRSAAVATPPPTLLCHSQALRGPVTHDLLSPRGGTKSQSPKEAGTLASSSCPLAGSRLAWGDVFKPPEVTLESLRWTGYGASPPLLSQVLQLVGPTEPRPLWVVQTALTGHKVRPSPAPVPLTEVREDTRS